MLLPSRTKTYLCAEVASRIWQRRIKHFLSKFACYFYINWKLFNFQFRDTTGLYWSLSLHSFSLHRHVNSSRLLSMYTSLHETSISTTATFIYRNKNMSVMSNMMQVLCSHNQQSFVYFLPCKFFSLLAQLLIGNSWEV